MPASEMAISSTPAVSSNRESLQVLVDVIVSGMCMFRLIIAKNGRFAYGEKALLNQFLGFQNSIL